MARAAIYYRVSTVDQSVDGQIAELREYAEKRGFEVVGEYVDHCSGAARRRPELDRMMSDVQQRKANIVLVWAFDRFARSTSHLVSTLEKLQSLGVDFVSYRLQIDTSTGAGKLTFKVLAAIAEFEREMIRGKSEGRNGECQTEGHEIGQSHRETSDQRIKAGKNQVNAGIRRELCPDFKANGNSEVGRLQICDRITGWRDSVLEPLTPSVFER